MKIKFIGDANKVHKFLLKNAVWHWILLFLFSGERNEKLFYFWEFFDGFFERYEWLIVKATMVFAFDVCKVALMNLISFGWERLINWLAFFLNEFFVSSSKLLINFSAEIFSYFSNSLFILFRVSVISESFEK